MYICYIKMKQLKLKIMKTNYLLSRTAGLLLTFESGLTKVEYRQETISYAKKTIIGSWKPEGIVVSVKRIK